MLSFSMILCQLPQAGLIENTFFRFYRAFTILKYINLVILPGAIADRASNINILRVKNELFNGAFFFLFTNNFYKYLNIW